MAAMGVRIKVGTTLIGRQAIIMVGTSDKRMNGYNYVKNVFSYICFWRIQINYMMESECDAVLNRIVQLSDENKTILLSGVPNAVIIVDVELNKIPNFQKVALRALQILSNDGCIRVVYDGEGYYGWQITNKGHAAIASGDTYVNKKWKEQIDANIKEFQFKTRWLPYLISGTALICSIIALTRSYNKEQLLPREEKPLKEQLKDSAQTSRFRAIPHGINRDTFPAKNEVIRPR